MKGKIIHIKKFKDFNLLRYGDSNIYIMSFKDDMRMSLSFMRFQENYESPKFRGKYFDSLEFIEWYCKSRDQTYFSYMEDWGGFNIPDLVIYRMNENIKEFSKFEKNVLDSKEYIEDDIKGKKSSKFYLLGTLSGDEKTLDHEISHGLWYTDSLYKRRSKSLIKKIDSACYESLKKWLIESGYHKSVIDDEITAYLSTDILSYGIDGIDKSYLNKISTEFKNNFKEFKNEL